MAWEVDGVVKLVGFTASADLSTHQYKFVKISGVQTVTICNGTTDKPIGVLQNAPVSGGAAEVCMVGISKVVVSGALSRDALIGTGASATAVALTPGTDTTKYVCGTLLIATGGASEVGTAVINCITPARAA